MTCSRYALANVSAEAQSIGISCRPVAMFGSTRMLSGRNSVSKSLVHNLNQSDTALGDEKQAHQHFHSPVQRTQPIPEFGDYL